MGFWNGSGISWTICKQYAPCFRQTTTTTPHHSIFTGWMLFLTPNQQCQSTEGTDLQTPNKIHLTTNERNLSPVQKGTAAQLPNHCCFRYVQGTLLRMCWSSNLNSNVVRIKQFQQIRNQTDLQTCLRQIWTHPSLHKTLIHLSSLSIICHAQENKCTVNSYFSILDVCIMLNAFNALALLVGRQGRHPACKNWVVGCWHGYLSGERCRLVYGPADATATHCLLLQ